MKNTIEYILFLGLSYFTGLIGLNLSRKFSFFIALLFFYLIPIRKKTVFENLTNAFPEYSEKKIKEIAFGSYKSFSIALVEILYMPFMTKNEMEKIVQCSNTDLIIKKFNEKNGVILLSAHFGNWEYVAVSVSLQVGIPFKVVIKPQRNPYVTKWLNKVRTKWKNEVVSLGLSIRQIYKVLKEKNIVAMVADQRGPAEGIRVNFFGRKVSIYPGPAIMSLKTNAPIIYGINVRQPGYNYKTHLFEIDKNNLPENEEEKIIELSQRHASHLEKAIRENPEQWLWMHKLWKY
ncbi:MAG: lysophospholipid acyltransferase family protein [Ignavibacteriaceae bacterium]